MLISVISEAILHERCVGKKLFLQRGGVVVCIP